MTIVLPIFFAACGFGLFIRKMDNRHWAALTAVIVLVLAYNFFKTPKPLTPPAGGSAPQSAS